MSTFVDEKILEKLTSAFETYPSGLSLNDLITLLNVDADTALKALSCFNAYQHGNPWYPPKPAAEQASKAFKPFFSKPKSKAESYCLEVEKLIIGAGTSGITISKIQDLSGLTPNQIYQAMTDISKAHVEIRKNKVAGVAYFTYLDVEFIPSQTTEKTTVTNNQSAGVINKILAKTKTVITKQLYLEKNELEQLIKETSGFTDLTWETAANGTILGVFFESKVEE